jgi:cytochrome c-type biogenesis protein CcmE
MTRKQRRLVMIGGGMSVLAVAVALMLNAFRDSIVFFNSPSDVVEKHVGPGTRIRLGGLVKDGSLVRGANLSIHFEVTDGKSEIPVTYQGVYSTPIWSLPSTTRPICPRKSWMP